MSRQLLFFIQFESELISLGKAAAHASSHSEWSETSACKRSERLSSVCLVSIIAGIELGSQGYNESPPGSTYTTHSEHQFALPLSCGSHASCHCHNSSVPPPLTPRSSCDPSCPIRADLPTRWRWS